MFHKMRRLIAAGMGGVLLAVALSGCASGGDNRTMASGRLDGLDEITVVTREEGSGTRSVFAESMGFIDPGTGRDQTLASAVSVNSSQEVVDAVAKDASAIGYVSAGILSDEQKVHAVTVDGKTLERTFYLAYMGKLTELEQDFITYIKGAGQKIVAETAKPVHKETSFLSGKPTGRLKVGGSTSVAGMIQKLADDYMKRNPNAKIEVVETDSTNGLTGTMEGTYDLGMSSRDLKDYEKELLSSEAIAKDEIAVIVQADNPLSNISSADLKNIYTGEVTEWKELDLSAKEEK